jgi:hypothetical protein
MEQARCEAHSEAAAIISISSPLPEVVGRAAKARHEKTEIPAWIMGDQPLNLIAYRLYESVAIPHGNSTYLAHFGDRTFDAVTQFAWIV